METSWNSLIGRAILRRPETVADCTVSLWEKLAAGRPDEASKRCNVCHWRFSRNALQELTDVHEKHLFFRGRIRRHRKAVIAKDKNIGSGFKAFGNSFGQWQAGAFIGNESIGQAAQTLCDNDFSVDLNG